MGEQFSDQTDCRTQFKVSTTKEDALNVEIQADDSVRFLPVRGFDKAAFLAKLEKLHQTLPVTESVMKAVREEQRY